jgi:hypothetical protein
MMRIHILVLKKLPLSQLAHELCPVWLQAWSVMTARAGNGPLPICNRRIYDVFALTDRYFCVRSEIYQNFDVCSSVHLGNIMFNSDPTRCTLYSLFLS